LIYRWNLLIVCDVHHVSSSSSEIVRAGKGIILEVEVRSESFPGHLIVSVDSTSI